METIGERLRYARKLRNQTQEGSALLTGIKQSTISKIERGMQQNSTEIAVLSAELKVEALWLSKGEGLTPGSKDLNDRSESQDGSELHENAIKNDIIVYEYADPRCQQSSKSNRANQRKSDPFSFSVDTFERVGINKRFAVA